MNGQEKLSNSIKIFNVQMDTGPTIMEVGMFWLLLFFFDSNDLLFRSNVLDALLGCHNIHCWASAS